jgi:serine/threonine-protein kinase
MLQKLGPYRIERLLGRGGMGSVYAGVHTETGERAAIKALALTLADDRNFRARFMAEIETLKQLRHPNIVEIIGDGEQDGQLYFVMELVEGQSLQEILQAGHIFTWQEVTRIAVDVCNALKHAHDCGVIHRDLKPANLLQTPDGHIKLTDFGIAKLFGATHRTADGSVVGTADYMSPEQSDGRPVTNRTDLYSLGAVMFTLLTRRTPFSGGNLPQVIHKLKYEEAPSVRRFVPDIPEELDQLIAELLRKEPQQRVATALVLANRLRAMEHALSAHEVDLVSNHQAETQIGPPPPPSNDPTQQSVKFSHPPTKLAPTFADHSSAGKNKKYTWNDATVITSATQERADQAGSITQAGEPVAGGAPAQNRFTTVEEHERQQAVARELERKSQPSAHLGAISIVAVAIVVIGLCIWGLQPPSADTLYQRIQRVSSRDGPADARKDIDKFLERFPQDPRYQEIDDLRMDVECDWLASRLRLRKRKSEGHGLEPYESRWLDAYHLLAKDSQKARAEFESIVAQYGSSTEKTDSLSRVLSAAQHQLKRTDRAHHTPSQEAQR